MDGGRELACARARRDHRLHARLEAAHKEIAKQGITSYLDASVGATELAALAALADRGPLTVRPSVAITVSPGLAADPERMQARIEHLRTTYARAGVTIRTVKLLFDGVIEYPTSPRHCWS